jgi:lysophospholipase L1-like esterase
MRTARILGTQVVLVLVLLEIALRFYNPVPFRVHGDRIVLPIHARYRFSFDETTKLDPIVHHTKNSLGFRGPEPPRDWARHLTILTIGGSTTECMFLSDGRTWTDRLAQRLAEVRTDTWINNAGFDGQSTFGHLVLLEQFVLALRPRVAIFLVGMNEVERGDRNAFDSALSPQSASVTHRVMTTLADHSEVAAMTENVARAIHAHWRGFGHPELDLLSAEHLTLDAARIADVLQQHRVQYLEGYARRLGRIIELCRKNRIEPVLVTQPALYGEQRDPVTGVDLGSVRVRAGVNGLLAWRVLELYNDVTRSTAAREHVRLINLATEMPKDSRYFYDFQHFTNEGAVVVANSVFEGLVPLLNAQHVN